MSRINVETTTTLEENFMFGSPPLLKGFAYNSCRSQESAFTHSNHESLISTAERVEGEDTTDMNTFKKRPTDLFQVRSSYPTQKYDDSNSQKQQKKNSSSQINGIANSNKILANNEDTKFVKRKDLRTLKSVLSKERFRQVVMKFGNSDEEGQEILESVHKTMKSVNTCHIKCLFCVKESQVYENFPVVDGTLFLSPVQLSKNCIKFQEHSPSRGRYMCFACINCMEGKPRSISCSGCGDLWNGSFFQIGTLYSYNILSAVPCCQKRVSCSKCAKPIIDVANGDLASIFFSHFSTKISCPHCKAEDYHFVKSLSYSLSPM